MTLAGYNNFEAVNVDGECRDRQETGRGLSLIECIGCQALDVALGCLCYPASAQILPMLPLSTLFSPNTKRQTLFEERSITACFPPSPFAFDKAVCPTMAPYRGESFFFLLGGFSLKHQMRSEMESHDSRRAGKARGARSSVCAAAAGLPTMPCNKCRRG